jgi:hypothetical protein
MFKALSHAFYGDQMRWFIGRVVDVSSDPLTLGRVRVNILGIHDGVNDAGDLPWASVVLPTTEGGLFTGFPPSLDVGAQVFGIFLDGVQSQHPLVIGSIPHILKDPRDIESGTDGEAYNPQDFGSGQAGTYQGQQVPVGTASESAEEAYNFFRRDGYSDAQARGIVGNMQAESGFLPENIGFDPVTKRDNGSMGVCQWRKGRLNGPESLKAFAAQRGLNPENLTTQFLFTKHELDTYPYYGKAELMRCSTPEQAAVTFCRKFENPADDPSGRTSAYRDPPYETSGNFPVQRLAEGERINNAKTIQFNSRPIPSRGI